MYLSPVLNGTLLAESGKMPVRVPRLTVVAWAIGFWFAACDGPPRPYGVRESDSGASSGIADSRLAARGVDPQSSASADAAVAVTDAGPRRLVPSDTLATATPSAEATSGAKAVEPCDPQFLGPFCSAEGQRLRLIGFVPLPSSDDPTPQMVRDYSLAALNHIRSRTCLPPLLADDCLTRIAEEALAANSGHGYFLANCLLNSAQRGRCECGWAQENIGAAGGTGRTWRDGIVAPLCGMMSEPKGVGHRSNIESTQWTRVGIGVRYGRNGASWFHEFGR